MTKAIEIPCTTCGAPAGVRCGSANGRPFDQGHHARRIAARLDSSNRSVAWRALADTLKEKAAAIRAATHQIAVDEAHREFTAAALRGLPHIIAALKAGRK